MYFILMSVFTQIKLPLIFREIQDTVEGRGHQGALDHKAQL